jgi:hypothetical protein
MKTALAGCFFLGVGDEQLLEGNLRMAGEYTGTGF